MVAFCADRSHLIGVTKLHVWPSGQQSVAIASVVSRRKHCVDVGQQKSDGKESPHCDSDGFPPQTLLSCASTGGLGENVASMGGENALVNMSRERISITRIRDAMLAGEQW